MCVPFEPSANIPHQLCMFQRIFAEPEREFAWNNELNQI